MIIIMRVIIMLSLWSTLVIFKKVARRKSQHTSSSSFSDVLSWLTLLWYKQDVISQITDTLLCRTLPLGKSTSDCCKAVRCDSSTFYKPIKLGPIRLDLEGHLSIQFMLAHRDLHLVLYLLFALGRNNRKHYVNLFLFHFILHYTTTCYLILWPLLTGWVGCSNPYM